MRHAQQRTFAHAAADYRFCSIGLILFVIVLLHFGFDGRRGVLELPDQRAAGNLDDQIFSGQSVHALAHAVMTVFREQPWDVILLEEVVQVVVGLQNHAAAAAAVAAARSALGHERFAVKGDGSLAAVAGAGVDFNFVNEHEGGLIVNWLNR